MKHIQEFICNTLRVAPTMLPGNLTLVGFPFPENPTPKQNASTSVLTYTNLWDITRNHHNVITILCWFFSQTTRSKGKKPSGLILSDKWCKIPWGGAFPRCLIALKLTKKPPEIWIPCHLISFNQKLVMPKLETIPLCGGPLSCWGCLIQRGPEATVQLSNKNRP